MAVFHSSQRYAKVVMVELLRKNNMTRIAVPRKNFPVIADVLSVVATETAWRIKVPDIVGIVLPRNVHFGEEISAVYSFDALDRSVNINLHSACGIRIPLNILFAYKYPDTVHRPFLGSVGFF